MRERESVRLTPALSCRHPHWSEHDSCWLTGECPRQDSNLRTRLRRTLLYPLSYGGVSAALSVRRRVEPYQLVRGVHERVFRPDASVRPRLFTPPKSHASRTAELRC